MARKGWEVDQPLKYEYGIFDIHSQVYGIRLLYRDGCTNIIMVYVTKGIEFYAVLIYIMLNTAASSMPLP